jgi:hypothetical protein
MLCGVLQTTFQIGRPMAINRLNGGVTQVRELGEPRWFGSWTYAPVLRSAFQPIQAWLDSLQGGLQLFYGHDTAKPYPVSYRTGVLPGGWNGLATVSGASGNTIGVTGMPATFVIKAGDMIGLIEGTKRAAFRITEDSSGPAAALSVEPRIVAGQFTAPQANFVRPVCTMVLDPGSVSATYTAGQPSSISFSGVQRVY